MREELIEQIRAHPGIDDSILAYCCEEQTRYIYGNGAQAATCLAFFREMDVPVHGVLGLPGYELPKLSGYWGRLLRSAEIVLVTELTERQRADAAVLIASPRESYGAARAFLERTGFRHIYTCAWERNQYLRDICTGL